MDNKNNIDQLRAQGWGQMSSLLDEHMPEKRRPIIWWYWAAGAAALVLAVTIPLTLLMNNDSSDPTVMVDQGPKMPSNEQNTPQPHDQNEMNSIASSSPKAGGAVKTDGRDDLAGSVDTFDRGYIRVNAKRKAYKVFEDGEKMNGHQKRVEDAPEVKENIVGIKRPDHFISTDGVAILDGRSFQVEGARKYLMPLIKIKDEPGKINVPKSSGKVYASVFSETMWSFSDRFGFVNAGPGINYGFGKWTLGLSGGVTIPLPHQKAFYSSNLPFSGQYNFDKQHESVNQDASFNSSSGAIYYEKYSMKPGFIVSMSAQHQLTDHWGIGVGIGRIGFRYDFTQKAEPNKNNIAAHTQLSNLQNSLWYSDVSIHYQLGEHWKIHGGARMINLLHAGDVGVLPSIRMEYMF